MGCVGNKKKENTNATTWMNLWNIMLNEEARYNGSHSITCDNVSPALNVQNRQIYMVWLGLRRGGWEVTAKDNGGSFGGIKCSKIDLVMDAQLYDWIAYFKQQTTWYESYISLLKLYVCNKIVVVVVVKKTEDGGIGKDLKI